IVLGFLILWSFLPVRLGDQESTLGRIVLSHATPGMPAGAAAGVLFLYLWTVRNQVSGLFVDLTGRKWIVTGLPIAMSALVTAAIYLAALLLPDPENRQRAIRYVPAVAYALAGVKLVVGAAAFAAL